MTLTSSSNPVLRNITDYLIEEASAEEEELLGGAKLTEEDNHDDKSEGETIEREETLIKVSNCCRIECVVIFSFTVCLYLGPDFRKFLRYRSSLKLDVATMGVHLIILVFFALKMMKNTWK